MSRKSYRVKFPGGSGFELAGIVDRPASGPDETLPADAPVVVFSHCFTCNKDLKAIVRISRTLAESGIAVLRYDMTGLGGSGGEFSRTNFSTNLLDLQSAIRFASSELGPVTTLMGHSFGGAASLAIAGLRARGEDPRDSPLDTVEGLERLGAVVALAAPSDTQHLAALLQMMNAKIESEGSGTVTIGGRDWQIRREMLEDFRRHDLPALVARIETPTLLMHSPVDETVAFHHALRLMGLIQAAPDRSTPVSLVSLAWADHLFAGSSEDLRFAAGIAGSFIKRYR